MSEALAALDRQPRGLVCACDVDTLDRATRLVEAVDGVDGVVGYKLGSLLALRHGLARTVEALRRATRRALIYDHQKAGLDVPSMAGEYTAVCRDAGVDALVLFPLAGPTAVDAFVGGALAAGLRPVVGGALPLPDYLARGGGYVAGGALGRIAERAWGLGARDFIVPATEPGAIRRQARLFAGRGPFRLFLPGIGALGGQIRTAFAAAGEGPAYAIVGRAIYAAPDPRAAARRLAEEALAPGPPQAARPQPARRRP